MSVYKAKRIQIKTSCTNMFMGKQWLDIGCSDIKSIRHKFSRYDMECNAFNASANTFTGYVLVAAINPHYCRLRAFRKHNAILAKADLCPINNFKF